MQIDDQSVLPMGSSETLAAEAIGAWASRWWPAVATVLTTSVAVLLASCLAVMMGLS